MIQPGPAKKLTIYVEESDKVAGRPAYEALMELFHRRSVAGVSAFRGVAGYGRDGVVHTAKMLELSTSLPVKIEVVDSEEVISAILPEVTSMLPRGIVEVSDTLVVSSGGKDLPPAG